jgi:hypothetical protein
VWIFLTIVLGGLVSLICRETGEREAEFSRLVRQCQDDGRREYECVALLRVHSSGSSVVPMPIVIPVRSR